MVDNKFAYHTKLTVMWSLLFQMKQNKGQQNTVRVLWNILYMTNNVIGNNIKSIGLFSQYLYALEGINTYYINWYDIDPGVLPDLCLFSSKLMG